MNKPELKPAETIAHSDQPLPTRPVARGTLDLTGARFGAGMRVVGLAAFQKQGSDKPWVWVVRCVCGIHEHRTTKAIRNLRNDQDQCRACRQVEYLKRRERELGGK